MASGSGRRPEISHLEVFVATRLLHVRPAASQSALRQHQSEESRALLDSKRRASVPERQIGQRESVRAWRDRPRAKVARRLDDERDQSPGARQSALLPPSRRAAARDRVSARSLQSVDNDAPTQNHRLLVHDERTALARPDGALHDRHTHDKLPLSEARAEEAAATRGSVERTVPDDERRDQVRLLLRGPDSAVARRLRALVLLLLPAGALHRDEDVPVSRLRRGALCRKYEKVYGRECTSERRRGVR